MKIGIIGLGYVGSAIYDFYSNIKGIDDIGVYDKYKNGGIGSFKQCLNSDFLYLCLPTPYCSKTKRYLVDQIEITVENLYKNEYNGIILIKSTVLPGFSAKLSKIYTDLNILHNPEFLSAKTASKDFANQSHTILGFTNSNQDIKDKLVAFHRMIFPKSELTLCSSDESETIKISANSFYAVKIQFFNEIYDLCQKREINYNIVKNAIIKNGWINKMHTDVPGHDGMLSYGGACFPKDTKSLLEFMKRSGVYCSVLDATVNEKEEMRKDNK